MNDESKNHEASQNHWEIPRDAIEITPGGQVNPYQAPQVDLPPRPEPTYRANLANDFATAALMMMLNIIGAAVVVPHVMVFASGSPQSAQFPWYFWLVNQVVSCGLGAAITIPIGVWLGSRVGLDAPVFRGIAKGDFSVLNPTRAGWIAAFIVGMTTGMLVFMVDKMLPPEVSGAGLDPDTIKALESAPAWVTLLASFGAGITEETWARFGVMAFIVWSGVALVGSERPSVAYLWIANIMAVIPTAAMYVLNLLFLGGEFSPSTLAYLVGYYALIALTCGWLYWKYGIESAMASRTISDILLRVALPFIVKLVT